MDLLVVESPTKANTLKRFLGSDWEILATSGHIKDLPKSKLGVDVENNFKPDIVNVEKKADSVKKIIASAKKASTVYIATDPDREGEAIAMHVSEVVNKKNTKRITFHEITKKAVEDAVKKPGKVDKNLVDAQIARRVLDRLVGYNLSPVLWKKVRRGLSAGRVQSVCVRLIVEREREIEKFIKQEYWQVFCHLYKEKGKVFRTELTKVEDKKFVSDNEEKTEETVKDLKKSDYRVSSINKREVVKHPNPPYTTSTLTQAAARSFYWSAKRTMSVAQKLYEQGLITYHRTDSTNISKEAIDKVRQYIKKTYGEKYIPTSPNFYKTKSKVAQEAHEAIRPTELNFNIAGLKKEEQVLFQLILKRFVSCQMSNMIADETQIEVEAVGHKKYLLQTKGQTMRFDGWRVIYGNTKLEGEELIPQVLENDTLNLEKVVSEQKFTQPPVRYSEAMLIKTLEKLGIGRPSTYAPTISTIQVRSYVEKEEGRFKPTHVGIAVNDFLVDNFQNIVDYSFTASMEDDLDKIANGNLVWTNMMGEFYKPFIKKTKEVEKKSKRVKIETEKTGRKCPECKKGELVIRIGRFGKFISCSNFPDCKYTEKYMEKANIKCPECKKGEVIIKKTRRGKKFYGCSRYPECKFASWKKPEKNEKATD